MKFSKKKFFEKKILKANAKLCNNLLKYLFSVINIPPK